MSKALESFENESNRLLTIIDDAHKQLRDLAKARDAYLSAAAQEKAAGGTVIEVPVAKIKAKG